MSTNMYDYSASEGAIPMDCSAIRAQQSPPNQVNQLTNAIKHLTLQVSAAQLPSPPNHAPDKGRQVRPQVQQQYQPRAMRQYDRPPPYPRQQPQRNRFAAPAADRNAEQANPPDYRYTPDGVPICIYCANVGHVQRQCRKRSFDLRNGRQPPQQAPVQQGQPPRRAEN